MNFLNHTKSLCQQCQRVIPAKVFEKEGKIFIESKCPIHGKVIADHVWDDLEIYKGLSEVKTAEGNAEQIVVDVTKKCNLNCKICFASANEYEGNSLKKSTLNQTKAYRRVFLSGGEPTVREDLPQMIKICSKNKQRPILFTNGVKLADNAYLKRLIKAGLRSVLLQLDSLNDKSCEYIRGRKLVKIKIRALENLNKCNIPVSVWTVAVKDKNLDELRELHKFLMGFPSVKTISAIPIWRIGRYDKADFVPPSEIIQKLSTIYGLKKSDFIATTKFVCNLDRLRNLIKKNRGRLFGVCMLKALVLKNGRNYISITNCFELDKVSRRLDKLSKSKNFYLSFIGFLAYFLKDQILLNFVRNPSFRLLVGRCLLNIKYLFINKSLLNPFTFITVGIFPNKKNIDLKFIENCNSFAFGNDDYAIRPACLHYIENERKNIYKNISKLKTQSSKKVVSHKL